MKDLIIKALNNVNNEIKKDIPKTKKDHKYIDITGVKPSEVSIFMKKNNIPDDAYFYYKNDDYWNTNIYLVHLIDRPLTGDEKENYSKKKFRNKSFPAVYKILTENGYKRVGFNSGLLKNFDKTACDMYQQKDFDRLVDYYSLSFKKINQ